MIRKQGSFLLELGDAGTNRPAFLLWWTDGTLTRLDGPPIPKFEWHHWAGTYDGTSMRLYIDGAVVSSLAISKTIATSSEPLLMGHWTTEWFAGILDEFQLFSRALNVDEIVALVSAAPPHAPGPILSYDMETLTADGRMKDLSGHSNHGTVSGTTDVAGIVGRARHFDGIADYIEVLDSSDLHVSAGITIAAWVYLQADHTGGAPTMIRKQGSFLLEVGDAGTNRPAFLLWWTDGTLTRLDGPPIPKFEWHHWAGTYDGTTMRLYIDGTVVSSLAISKTIATSTEPLRMGHWTTEWFQGILDEVQLFSRALSVDEIVALVSAAPPHAPGPVLAYDMETLTADGRMKDLSGHSNHGTISGTTDVAGIVGRARHFDGIADYIEVPDSADLHVSAGITIAAWVYLQADHTGGAPTMIRKQGSFLLELGDAGTNRPAFLLWWADGTLTRLDGPPIPKFEWHHWAGTYDGTTMRLYIDGVVVNSLAVSKTIATSPEPLRMGHWATEWFAGILDEVRLYSRGLTGEEIAALVSGS